VQPYLCSCSVFPLHSQQQLNFKSLISAETFSYFTNSNDCLIFIMYFTPPPPCCDCRRRNSGLSRVRTLAWDNGFFSSKFPVRLWGPLNPCTMGTGYFPGVRSGRGVTLTPYPLLVLWSWKSRAISLLPVWGVRPVQNLSACTRVTFTLPFKAGVACS
jgi:hypothetical protein